MPESAFAGAGREVNRRETRREAPDASGRDPFCPRGGGPRHRFVMLDGGAETRPSDARRGARRDAARMPAGERSLVTLRPPPHVSLSGEARPWAIERPRSSSCCGAPSSVFRRASRSRSSRWRLSSSSSPPRAGSRSTAHSRAALPLEMANREPGRRRAERVSVSDFRSVPRRAPAAHSRGKSPGIGYATQDALLEGIVAVLLPDGRRSLTFGVFHAGFGVGWLAGAWRPASSTSDRGPH